MLTRAPAEREACCDVCAVGVEEIKRRINFVPDSESSARTSNNINETLLSTMGGFRRPTIAVEDSGSKRMAKAPMVDGGFKTASGLSIRHQVNSNNAFKKPRHI